MNVRSTASCEHSPSHLLLQGPAGTRMGSYDGHRRIRRQQVVLPFDVALPPNATQELDTDIIGTYKLLASYATANGSLHVREEDDAEARSLFFFLDLDRYKDKSSDNYVSQTTSPSFFHHLSALLQRRRQKAGDPSVQETSSRRRSRTV